MPKTVETVSLDGGLLCLNFVNTIATRRPQAIDECLCTWEDWLVWSERVAILPADALIRLQAAYDQQPATYSEPLKRVIDVRETFYQLVREHIDGLSANSALLERFNAYLSETYQQLRLEPGLERFNQIVRANNEADIPLHQVILSAEALLTSAQLSRVKKCAAPTCDWLFFDTSKNGSRRWCSMRDCGSQAKATAYYHRVVKKSSDPA